MNSVIELFNKVTSWIIDILLYPFGQFAPEWGLVFISCAAGVLFLFIYGAVSNQSAIAKVKRDIHASLLETILFRHNIKLCLGAQLSMLKKGGEYFARAVPPIIILLVPCLLLLAHLNVRYDARGFAQGEQGVIKAKVSDRKFLYKLSMVAEDGVSVTPPLRIPESNEIAWRVNFTGGLPSALKFALNEGNAVIPAPFAAMHDSAIKSTAKVQAFISSSWFWNLLYPLNENPLLKGDSVIKELSITYPHQDYSIFGMQMHWLMIFGIVSILAGVLASKYCGIEI